MSHFSMSRSKKFNPNAKLAAVFNTVELKDRITYNSTNQEVIDVIRKEVDGAFDRTLKILRTRIDRYGVAQPNIQPIASSGRIMVELPGVKEPERVRKLLQGTAKLNSGRPINSVKFRSSLTKLTSIWPKPFRNQTIRMTRKLTTRLPKSRKLKKRLQHLMSSKKHKKTTPSPTMMSCLSSCKNLTPQPLKEMGIFRLMPKKTPSMLISSPPSSNRMTDSIIPHKVQP
ncbi:MAG: hypothetical protein U5L09_19625 [Bacteroidales bacterium]|nr:hypothetical protein [Bacteroidales bacterium]